MYVHHQFFNDADDHAAALRGWDQRYDQIGSGTFRSAVKQIELDGVQVFHESANLRVVQRGQLPDNHMTFGIPLAGAGAFSFGGVRIDRGGFVMAQGGTPFEFHSPDEMALIGVVVDSDMLQGVADCAGVDLDDNLFRRTVLDIPNAACTRAGLQLATLIERVLAQPEAFDDVRAQHAVRNQVSEALVDLLAYHVPATSNRLTYACQADIVRRIHDFVINHPDELIDIQSLCTQLRVSRRTVQNSFQAVVQTNPLAYVRSLRLAQVRRLLLDTRQADLSVSDAAAQWGFVHLGHFASAYKAQFGELPSHTVRRSSRAIPAR
ncbi:MULTISPECIES: helix-turn-helix domain-containing protein [Paraburkholderia]|uniref:AraC family transcriptional regulator n=1 Tax=Paraburkholderia caribensis TaxID=75105 RepID=A0A9Q6S6S0_9BURK|nr:MULTISPECIES: helix-turn-helix domain-containing protein [Paraburkholderia]AMV46816.1 AraC family transcriptional regulator [Paraburkholderia caribensis]MCO4879173.1 helix-turn-helix domain-containing protein [Paraburkholderia caribensis]MDR6382229.1 AraC-like DNA-binding protein [Paraburkholderia caribensis]PTB27539.1 AraC family transcriptional regulator [Paraburkholderia caribensis]QLB65189.1 AraC family transcriptional regulator [Paraburkholderia caribensis]